MKAETLTYIKSQLKPLIDVLCTGINVFPSWTILITMRIALSNACRNDSSEEDMDNLVKFFCALKKHDHNQHFVVYIADEVYMIIHGNEMSEEYDDNYTATYAELKPYIKEEDGFQIIDTVGKIWVKEVEGDIDDPVVFNKYYSSEPNDDDIYRWSSNK